MSALNRWSVERDRRDVRDARREQISVNPKLALLYFRWILLIHSVVSPSSLPIFMLPAAKLTTASPLDNLAINAR